MKSTEVYGSQIPLKEVRQAIEELPLEELRAYATLNSVMLSLVAGMVAPGEDFLMLDSTADHPDLDLDVGQAVSKRVQERVQSLIEQNKRRN